jgi:hypothetical protein
VIRAILTHSHDLYDADRATVLAELRRLARSGELSRSALRDIAVIQVDNRAARYAFDVTEVFDVVD